MKPPSVSPLDSHILSSWLRQRMLQASERAAGIAALLILSSIQESCIQLLAVITLTFSHVAWNDFNVLTVRGTKPAALLGSSPAPAGLSQVAGGLSPTDSTPMCWYHCLMCRQGVPARPGQGRSRSVSLWGSFTAGAESELGIPFAIKKAKRQVK